VWIKADSARSIPGQPRTVTASTPVGTPSTRDCLRRLDWGELAWISRPSDTGAEQITAVLVTLAPSRGHDFHRHPRQEEVLYVLAGEVEQWLETKKRTLKAGDAVFVGRGIVHASFNTGGEPARFLAVLSPCVGDGGYESEEVAGESPWRDLRR
jgi:quercetin dioxygenase-like cupin family protein